MVAYEFYWRDPIKGYQYIGKLPERRKNLVRINRESIINWGKSILGENVGVDDVFFIKITLDKNAKRIFQPHSVYRSLKEF